MFVSLIITYGKFNVACSQFSSLTNRYTLAAYAGNLMASLTLPARFEFYLLPVRRFHNDTDDTFRSASIDYFQDIIKDPNILLVIRPHTSIYRFVRSSNDPILVVGLNKFCTDGKKGK